MLPILEKSTIWCDKKLTVQTGRLARQANSSVLVNYADTVILCTLTIDREELEAQRFLPLTVHFSAKSYATGKIPGGFFKREGKPTEHEILISRIIDRSIRPFFDKNFNKIISISCILLSTNGSTTPEIPAIIAASIAASIANIPFCSTIAAVRLIQQNKQNILNPSTAKIAGNTCDLIISGTMQHISMIEASANNLSTKEIAQLIENAQSSICEIINFINSFIEELKINKSINDKNHNNNQKLLLAIQKKMDEKYFDIFKKSLKKDMQDTLNQFNIKITEKLIKDGFNKEDIDFYLPIAMRTNARKKILNSNLRLDGRKNNEIRNISSDVGILKHTHGSSLFTRGNTQVLATTTFGSPKDEQIIECLDSGEEIREWFMLHYNFPSFAVGEVATKPGPTRREIGHGKLAAKAFAHVLPIKNDFPYTIRNVAEILESDGSSSMATVCATSMALMDAGVPIKKHVVGIAMGLIKENDQAIILSDISGTEDMFGDMDFKITGTEDGITALQMDTKISGINTDLLLRILNQSTDGINFIIKNMIKTISTHSANFKNNVNPISTMNIEKHKIKDVIGSGGKTIKNICETTKATIDVAQNGVVKITAPNTESMDAARSMINSIIVEIKIGKIYECKVMKIMDFGIVVSFMNGKQGLIHSSELSLELVEQGLQIGTQLNAKLITNENGRFKLSAKKL
ncbi:Polyribonucleotide nucleotidyltransferase [Candidatus Xenohaliotis californiensis]|uniref:Polyribonucleotide nucleotidyltransferase n=1 Tax=Candidatus Xenohaliotis californiensis TaxID=84677 RepID=A0ABP0EXB6_9RICK|nr:Polyribonucleotide nucleotidyltransferase [Candidatus Xenohaliotis californiensis]